MAITEVGEVGIHLEDENVRVLLRPSLLAMASLGQPEEVVELFARVMGTDPRIEDCAAVLMACCAEEDLEKVSDLVGHPQAIYPPIHRKLHWNAVSWIPGKMPLQDVLHLARCLLKHGVVGVVKSKSKRPKETTIDSGYKEEFDAHSWASVAIAHLGMSEQAAWSMTMTGLLAALNTKFPPKPEAGENAPSVEEYEATMAWFEQVTAARKAASKEQQNG